MSRVVAAITLVAALAMPASAAVVAATSRGVAVAHDGIVELFDDQGRRVFSVPGVERATAMVTGDRAIAVLDAWTNELRRIDLRDGSGLTLATGETPLGGVFIGEDLYILERDARAVSRVGRDGTRTAVAVGADPAFIAQADGRIYVYSRLEGLLQEINPRGGISRTVSVGAFASDMAVDGTTAYLVFPRQARLVSVDLRRLEVRQSVAAGGAPASVAVVGTAGALSAAKIAVADPAAKRIWITEGSQSFGAAFGRGFLRGLIGAGLFRVQSEEFPTGVDRVLSRDGVTVAFDSATGTLYRVGRRQTAVIGQELELQSFALTANGIAIWSGRSLRLVD